MAVLYYFYSMFVDDQSNVHCSFHTKIVKKSKVSLRLFMFFVKSMLENVFNLKQLYHFNYQDKKITRLEFLQATAASIANVKIATSCFEDYKL